MYRSITLPIRLTNARARCGMTQAELAKSTGLHPAAVSHYETGGREPALYNLVRLAKALRVTTDWLLGINYHS